MRSERKVSASVNNFVVHRLREIRVERGLKAREVARRAGISPGSFGCLENGFYRINLENLFKILQVLDARVEQVWPQADRPSQPIDRAYIEQAVEQAVERVPRPVELEDIFNAVSRAFEVPKDKLLSPSRWKRLEEARAVCGLLAKEAGIKLKPLCGSLRVSIPAMASLIRQYRVLAGSDNGFAAKVKAARESVRGWQ